MSLIGTPLSFCLDIPQSSRPSTRLRHSLAKAQSSSSPIRISAGAVMLALEAKRNVDRTQRRRGTCRRCLFQIAAFDRRSERCQPPFAKPSTGNAIGIDEWIAAPEIPGPGRRPRLDRPRRCRSQVLLRPRGPRLSTVSVT